MNRIFTLLLGLLLSLQLNAQEKLKVDYDNDSRWFWTLNAGGTWTKADVKYKTDWGYGITIGKSFNYNYGRPISFDIRARYLTGAWYGQAGDTSGFQYGNNALSTGSTDYKTNLGYAVLNHQTKLHELSLELVLHANNVRANSGWDPYIFGGIGYTWYRAKGDLLGANDTIYDYNTLVSNNTLSASTAANMQDGKFESILDGSTSADWRARWMPSVGFGLGYQFGPRFSMGFEHKTTFTMEDVFDGSVNPTGKYANDWYHYSGVYMKFHIKDHPKVVDVENDNSLDNVNNFDQVNQNNPPQVHFTNPATSGTVVSSPNYVIKASIVNVASSQNVVFRQNGQYNTNFTFNPSTQSFESIVTLQPGQNVFELTGTNTVGSAQDQTIIIYNREQNNPPVVTYNNPAASPTTVQNPNFNVIATILNVDNSNQVTMTLNGAAVAGVSFSSSNHVANANITLQVGTNIVTTTGTNAYGTDSESTTIIYNPQQTVQPPVVYFVDPNSSPYTTNNNTFVINADVLNVAGAQNVLFKQNGNVNQNFTYNAQTDDFQSTVVLNPGQNVFEIVGSNSAGSASASTIIVYNRPAPKPPVVTITNPSNNPHETANAVFNLTSTVLNVTQASQIKVKLNGNIIPFNYNNTNNGVYATLNLVQGSNVVSVTGTNADGTDSKQTTIIYRPAQTVQPPVVQITVPNANPFTVAQADYTLLASVLNVPNVSGVNVTVNGSNVTNFTFNGNSVTVPLVLIEGANMITVTGTNTAGTASDQQTIIYRKPVVAQPPVVSFIDPAVSPTTVFSATYPVKARVRFVTGASQIALTINGAASTNFVYSVSSEIMDFTTALVPGANVISIVATNADGQGSATTTIIYRRPVTTNPPVVTITNPFSNPATVSASATPVTATVLNVENQSGISVTLNGTAVTNFVYNDNTKQVTFTATLNQGSNTVVVTGTNSAGTASDTKTILFRPEVIVQPPFVTFVNPGTSGTIVNLPNYTVKVKFTNILAANQIVFLQDGNVVNPSMWVYDPSSAILTYNTTLNPGNNVFTATGTNTAGNHTASTSIEYRIPVVVCDKPVITITNPSSQGLSVNVDQLAFTATITNITNANQVKVLLNGNLQPSGTYIQGAGTYARQLVLVEGQNAIEVIALNACGETKAITTVIYNKPSAPCIAPVIQLLDPTSDITVEVASVQFKAAISNVPNGSNVTLSLNGVIIPATFDQGSHILSTTLNLVEGENKVLVKASNDCGGDQKTVTITRKACQKPKIELIRASATNGAIVEFSNFDLMATVTGVQESNNIVVTHNGNPVAFVFNPNTGILNVKCEMVIGANTFEITATNTCGSATYRYTLTRKQVITVQPPTIHINNPASNMTVTSSGMTVEIVATNVTSESQVTVTLNGSPVNFTFNPASGAVTFNATFNQGANIISCGAVNTAGSANDSRTVIYNVIDVVAPPVITLINPATCPAALPRGLNTIQATVTNVSDPNQITVTYNGSPVTFTSQVANNTVTISFQINVGQTSKAIPLMIQAGNSSGVDTEICEISLQGNGNNGHGNNTDGTDESNPGNGTGGPNGGTNGTEDDENTNGGGNGGGNGNGNGGQNKTAPTGTPKPTIPTTTTPKPVGRP